MSFEPHKARDPALDQILALYRQLEALPPMPLHRHETPAHHALIRQIRTAVEARRQVRGDEMIEVAGHPPSDRGGRRR